MRRRLIFGAAGTLVLAGTSVFAAKLVTPPNAFLAAGDDSIPVCDENGVTSELVLDGSQRITSVTLDDIAATCTSPVPQQIQVVLVDESGLVLSQLSSSATAATITLPLSEPLPAVSDLSAIKIAIVEPAQ